LYIIAILNNLMSFIAGILNKDHFPNHLERKTEGQFAMLKVRKECLNQLRSPLFQHVVLHR